MLSPENHKALLQDRPAVPIYRRPSGYSHGIHLPTFSGVPQFGYGDIRGVECGQMFHVLVDLE